MESKNTQAARKYFREMDKKAAISDAEKARRKTLEKTAKLRELRLAKEAETRAEEALKPKKKAKKTSRGKLPEFVREA